VEYQEVKYLRGRLACQACRKIQKRGYRIYGDILAQKDQKDHI